MVLFAIMIWPRCLVSVKVQVTVSLAARVMEAVAVPGPATGGAVVVKVLVPRLEVQLSPVRTQPAGMASLTEYAPGLRVWRSEEHTSELQSQSNLVCRLLLEKKKKHSISSQV